MADWIKKNQYWLSIFLGIALALAEYIFNPFALKADAAKAVAVAILMISWWITEALPMPAVALLPLILHPLLQLSTLRKLRNRTAIL